MSHLVIHGINLTYTCWTRHRETINGVVEHTESCASPNFDKSAFKADHLDDMAKALKVDLQDCPKMMETLKGNVGKPLY